MPFSCAIGPLESPDVHGNVHEGPVTVELRKRGVRVMPLDA
jgi:hypothetical protein